jgi:hypothetical protein
VKWDQTEFTSFAISPGDDFTICIERTDVPLVVHVADCLIGIGETPSIIQPVSVKEIRESLIHNPTC